MDKATFLRFLPSISFALFALVILVAFGWQLAWPNITMAVGCAFGQCLDRINR